MARLRYSRQEAEAEAARRAVDFLSRQPGYKGARFLGTHPDSTVRTTRSSKHAVAWIAVFVFDQPDGAVVDGGELFVRVNLESGAIVVCD